jgi:GR25 family glycosyltransferase involved in LPS biosynthesis
MIASWEDLNIDFHVINMKKSDLRRSRMELQLSERRIKHRFVDAIDGDDATTVQAAFTCNPDSTHRIYTPRESPIRDSELACTLSHMLAIRGALSMGLRHVIICEDDIEIGDVQAGEIGGILAAMPADAAYVQLCILGAETIHSLAKYYFETGQLFARKANDRPTGFVEKAISHLSCHCAAAYIITAAGMQNICEQFFDGSRVIFPCRKDEIASNVGLVADRFVYQAAVNERYPGYACCTPTFLLEAAESLIHPNHVEWHKAARSAAEFCRKRIVSEYLPHRPWPVMTLDAGRSAIKSLFGRLRSRSR